MAGITHAFVSAVGDGADATLVRPSNWNASHVIEQVITDNAPLTVDDASAADGDLCFFSANGIEGVAVTGATLPAANTMVGYFIHSPTGRSILYFSNGTSWYPVMSLGAMTVYVDATDGTDDANHGTAVDGDAFATVQYAVNTIPGLVGGNVTININGETYAEDVTITGKSFTGTYTITLQGTLTAHATNAQTASAQGATTNFGTISDTTNDPFAGHANDLLYSSNNAEYRVIDSVTTEVATIVEYWAAAPSGNYTIYQWLTTIQSITLGKNQVGIRAYDCYFTGAGVPVAANEGSFSQWFRCKFYTSAQWASFSCSKGTVELYDCYATSAGYCVMGFTSGTTAILVRCKVLATGASSFGILILSASYVSLNEACVVDGTAASSNTGMEHEGAGLSNHQLVYSKIRNWTNGIGSIQGSTVFFTGNNQYASNTANETAVAASYSYID